MNRHSYSVLIGLTPNSWVFLSIKAFVMSVSFGASTFREVMVGIVVAVMFGSAFSAESGQPKPGGAPKPPTSDVPAAEQPSQQAAASYTSIRLLPGGVTLAVLSNGLTVIVQENHSAPVATVRCFVRNTGSAFEGRYLGSGISHVLEHVVSGGTTTKRTEKEIERIIDSFGGATNAATWPHMTAYYIDCPAKNVMTAIELMADAMQRVKFEPIEFERELKVVRRELADGETDRRRVLGKLLSQTVYLVSPARHPIIGYLDVLNSTTNEAIIDFYRERYVPNNQILVVVGDVNTQQVLDEVARQWSGTPRGPEVIVPLPDEPEQLSPREAVREMDGKTYDLALAWPTVKLHDPDMFALDVAAAVLGQGESSRLVQRLKYEKQLVLAIGAANYTPHYVAGMFTVTAVATPDRWQQAVDEILREVYRLGQEPISEAELAKVKKQTEADLVFSRQRVQEAANSLGRSMLTTGDPLFDETYVDGIRRVTAQQIQQAARRYLVPQRLNRVIIAPPGGAPKPPDHQAQAADSPVQLHRLPNGLRVLLKRQSNLPLVNMQAFVLAGGLVDDPSTAGRTSLVAEMLDKGTSKHSAAQIASFFDSIGAQFSIQAGRFTIYASATCLRDDFPQAAAMLAECFTEPAFPAEQFQIVQRLALGAIARRADNAQSEALEVFYDSLPPTTPYHLIQGGKEETVKRLTVEDLRQYHARYFVPNNMLVAVFGDIEPEAALRLVDKHFGHLKPDADFRPHNFDRSNTLQQTVVRHKQTGKPTAMVVLGFPGPSIRDREDFAALTLLDAVISGYDYPGGWLHNWLRGEGLVYFVDAVPIVGPSPGYLVMLAQTYPDKIDQVVARMKEAVQRVKAGQITQEEFDTAVSMVLALHAQRNTTIAEQARQAALDELYGLGYDYDRTFEARIKSVRREDLARVANKYLNNYVLVTTSQNPASVSSKEAQ